MLAHCKRRFFSYCPWPEEDFCFRLVWEDLREHGGSRLYLESIESLSTNRTFSLAMHWRGTNCHPCSQSNRNCSWSMWLFGYLDFPRSWSPREEWFRGSFLAPWSCPLWYHPLQSRCASALDRACHRWLPVCFQSELAGIDTRTQPRHRCIQIGLTESERWRNHEATSRYLGAQACENCDRLTRICLLTQRPS